MNRPKEINHIKLNMSWIPTMCWGCVWFRFSVDLDVQIEDEEEDGTAAGPHGGG